MNKNALLSYRKEEPENGVLYIVGTPIGNLADISKRVSNILQGVSLIACEDTRTTKKLLNYLGITKKLSSYHKFSSKSKLKFFISKLEKGDSIALVSDAGMPTISDPGNNLVRKVKEKDLDVICVPGPCAAITGLVSSGIDTSKFAFYGFMPKIKKERNEILKIIAASQITTIIYESPKRILKLLDDLKDLIGINREIVVLKELTKRYEQHFGFKIDHIIKNLRNSEPKGEFTIVIAGEKKINDNLEIMENDLRKEMNSLIKAGLSHSSAANYLSKKSGVAKNYIYKLILNNDLE